MPGFDVEIVKYFHMIRDEADGSDHNCAGQTLLFQLAQIIQDVGLKPSLPRSAAAALVHEDIILYVHRMRCEPSHFFQLLYVVRGVGHRHRDTVSDIDNLDVSPLDGWDLRQGFSQPVFGGFKESGEIVEDAELVDLRRTFPDFGLSACDVFAILSTTRVRAVG